MKYGKVENNIHLSEMLDMSPYCKEKKGAIYKLKSIVNHVGRSTHKGKELLQG